MVASCLMFHPPVYSLFPIYDKLVIWFEMNLWFLFVKLSRKILRSNLPFMEVVCFSSSLPPFGLNLFLEMFFVGIRIVTSLGLKFSILIP